MQQRITIVDAFTDRPFAGNPAAVCVMEGPADETWMQQVAAEMNLSETAFLYPEAEAYRLRWFTPVAEVDLCGHATLAASHVLWEEGKLAPDAVARYNTRSGQLEATRSGVNIEMDFPAMQVEAADGPATLLDSLRVEPVFVGRSRFDYLIEVTSEEDVRALTPDFTRLKSAPARGVIVTSRSSSRSYDFVSRFFAPAVGVDEDPVTGSAHCCLAPFWANRLGKDEMIGFQASRRGGKVGVRLRGDRVMLIGSAVTTLRASLAVPAPNQREG